MSTIPDSPGDRLALAQRLTPDPCLDQYQERCRVALGKARALLVALAYGQDGEHLAALRQQVLFHAEIARDTLLRPVAGFVPSPAASACGLLFAVLAHTVSALAYRREGRDLDLPGFTGPAAEERWEATVRELRAVVVEAEEAVGRWEGEGL